MGGRWHYLFALVLFIAAVTLTILALVNSNRNWWTVEPACAGIPAGVKVNYGPLGYWDPIDNEGKSYSSKSSDLCYPLRTGAGGGTGTGNTDLRYIGITAVVVMAISLLFSAAALLQALLAFFGFGHSHRHAKHAAHSAILAGFLVIIGAILVLGWYIGVADSYNHSPPRWIGYAQILALIAPFLLFVGAAIVHHGHKHHGYERF